MDNQLAFFGGSPVRKTPFHGWPVYGEEEEKNIKEVLQATKWGIGKRTGVIERFEKDFAAYHQIENAVACTNCTQALEVSLLAAGVKAFDEVILPAYTFIATATAVAKIGAIPIFADIQPETLLIDPAKVEKLITPKTKAILPVHFAGQMVDLEALEVIVNQRNLKIIEDAAQAHGAKRGGSFPGNYGPACFSFQYSKNMTAGEGGIILSKDKDFIDRCWEIIWHGRKKGGLWYEHFETTSNYRITEWSAAVLLAQLTRLSVQTKHREENAKYLTELLLADNVFLPTFVDPKVQVHSRHLFPLRINRQIWGDISKQKIVDVLNAEGIPVLPGYKFPLYRNPAFQNGNWGINGINKNQSYKDLFLEGAEIACQDTIWLIHNILLGTREDMFDISFAINKLKDNISQLYVN